MDRDEIIGILKAKSIPIDKCRMLIAEYCREFDKEQSDIDKLLSALFGGLGSYIYVQPYVTTALEYYKKKFNIITVNNNTSFITAF